MFGSKCKSCNGKMTSVTASIEVDIDGKKQKAINVPAKQCGECGNVVVNDFVLERLEGYALRYPSETLDFAQCEDEESVASQSIF